MKIRRTFSDEFKAKIVEMITDSAASQVELSRNYGISPVMKAGRKENMLTASSLKIQITLILQA